MASIVVVGGSLSGLFCAWRLQQAGHDVEVLERDPEPGGRLRTRVHGDFRLDPLPPWITRADRNLQRAFRALDLTDRLHPFAWSRPAILRDGAFQTVDLAAPWRLLRSPLVSLPARLRWARLALELFRRRALLDRLHPERAAAIDRESVAGGARRILGDENLERVVGPAFSAAFHAEPEDGSWACALIALRFLAQRPQLESLRGGSGALVQALAERVPVRTRCEVISVETATDGARVRYRAGDRRGGALADAVVVALPGSRVAALCPKLTPPERGFFEHVRYAAGIGVHLLLESAPPGLPGFAVAFPRSEGFDLSGLAVDHYRVGQAPLGAGLLNVPLTPRASERMWKAPDAEVADLVLAHLARTPLGRLTPSEAVVHRMPSRTPCFEAGFLPRLARFEGRMDRSPRLAFAGDYRIGPSLEAAAASGARAAFEIDAAL